MMKFKSEELTIN